MTANDTIMAPKLATAIPKDTANPGKPTPQKIATEKYLQTLKKKYYCDMIFSSSTNKEPVI